MGVEEATTNFRQEAGMARYATPGEMADLMASLVSLRGRWMPGPVRMDGNEVKLI
jgi:3-oxoacyl-[acyl-carrier protein] reductase